MNYRGYFVSLDDIHYQVDIITDSASTATTEIYLAGESPFVVTYDTSATPFDAVRTSTATVKIVWTSYLTDIYSSSAQGTQVKLTDTTNNKIKWIGWLNPNLLSQPYESSGYETIELEATDCLGILQYLDYEPITGVYRIQSFKSILDKICDDMGLLRGYYWSNTKGEVALLPHRYTVSEKNFVTSDSEDPWTELEVMEEMAKYVGFTAFQWEDALYLFDLQAYHTLTAMPMTYYAKSGYTAETVSIGSAKTITSSSYRQTGGQISYETVYNKATVNCNFYEADFFIPDLFEDDYLHNRYGASYECRPLANYDYGFPAVAEYIDNHDRWKDEETSDAKYTYYNKMYNHDDYESVYYTSGLTPYSGNISATTITKNIVGATIVDLAHLESQNTASTQTTKSDISFEKYLCISQMGHPTNYTSPYYDADTPAKLDSFPTVFRLTTGHTCPVVIDNNSFITINASTLYERYRYRNWINPDWTGDTTAYGESNVGYYPGALICKLGIDGIGYWNGTTWTSDTNTAFAIKMTVDMNDDAELDYTEIWNKSQEVVNNVSWTTYAGISGYKIPFPAGTTSIDGDITFEIKLPGKIQRYARSKDASGVLNNYCWVKDLEIKISTKLKDEWKSDVVYSNVITGDSINEMDEIDLKLTTYPGEGSLSYSNVGMDGQLLVSIQEPYNGNCLQKPEENIINKYVEQYQTPTLKEDLTLDMSFTPMDRINDSYWNKNFVVLGQTIDYANDKQDIEILEKK